MFLMKKNVQAARSNELYVFSIGNAGDAQCTTCADSIHFALDLN